MLHRATIRAEFVLTAFEQTLARARPVSADTLELELTIVDPVNRLSETPAGGVTPN